MLFTYLTNRIIIIKKYYLFFCSLACLLVERAQTYCSKMVVRGKLPGVSTPLYDRGSLVSAAVLSSYMLADLLDLEQFFCFYLSTSFLTA